VVPALSVPQIGTKIKKGRRWKGEILPLLLKSLHFLNICYRMNSSYLCIGGLSPVGMVNFGKMKKKQAISRLSWNVKDQRAKGSYRVLESLSGKKKRLLGRKQLDHTTLDTRKIFVGRPNYIFSKKLQTDL